MGHIHAELMAQYAEDAKQYDRPWEMWQHGGHEDWVGCTTHPSWHRDHSYRRKPRSTVVGEHVNAEILRAIADGKKVQYRKFHPLGWEPIQNADTVQCWKLLKGGYTVEWRVVPETVMIGEHEVPEPHRKPLEIDDTYWTFTFYLDGVNKYCWANDLEDNNALKNGFVHLTKEAAEKHFDALKSFTAQKE